MRHSFCLKIFSITSIQLLAKSCIRTVEHKILLLFRKLGEDWSVPDTLVDELEEFTCVMYGYAHEKSVNLVRYLMLQKIVGEDDQLTTETKVDLSKLPPDRDSLIHHIKRTNYRVAN